MSALQIDESVDIIGKSHLLAFGKFIYEEEIREEFLLSNGIKRARYFQVHR